ncbi:hypothetical protein AB4Z27_28135 [Cupriavidus sp. KB_39]|uniref:hypothetical protein n=1 Tax=Cupriavidus sp. KB_39 TaxID=3233036 RepID=UPI003F8E8931
MQMKDGRAIARENEIRVLRALHRFGWMRTRDLAALVWQHWEKRPVGEPDLKPAVASASGLRMAQRTLLRLTGARQVLRGQAPDGSLIYALSEAGARRLQHFGVPAASGKDLIRSFSAAQFRHRCVANEIAIGSIIAGFRVSTEREIAQDRWLGGADGISGKKPDVLLHGGGRVWWVEVEKSRKNAKDYARLLNWLTRVCSDALCASGPVLLGSGLRWAKIVFVCTPTFKAKLCRDLAAAGWMRSSIDSLIMFMPSLYSFEDIKFA